MNKDCYRSMRVSATCARCGQRTELTHMPLTKHGFFCSGCCPACNPPRPPKPELATLADRAEPEARER